MLHLLARPVTGLNLHSQLAEPVAGLMRMRLLLHHLLARLAKPVTSLMMMELLLLHLLAGPIFERALRAEHQNTGIWRKYLETETMTLRMLPSSLRLPSRCSRTWVQGATPQRRTLPCFGPLAAGEAWRDGGCRASSARLGT